MKASEQLCYRGSKASLRTLLRSTVFTPGPPPPPPLEPPFGNPPQESPQMRHLSLFSLLTTLSDALDHFINASCNPCLVPQ